ncbi:MAG: bifunctional UDP-N-acetylglucosamine diphosphorylase/glucosamine-1-phosphate N-acetyltransferase GlmU [Holosporaceae bacterium]|nr:bifunctional UDP-N-acetylglucosamine diphosphorylase/glucosamine-1-phosphate N-acetyltransferase GlmU [Holosporaceae bacterium]
MNGSVIILAAGVGSRLKSSVPKVYHKIGGLSLIDHVIGTAKALNPSEIVAVLNPKHKDIELVFESSVKRAYQDVPKGTADAVKCALESLQNDSSDGWVYVLYGDIPLVSSETLLKLAEISKTCEKTAVVVLAMDSSGTYGLGRLECADEKGTVKSIIEAKDMLSSAKILPLCNAGLLIRKNILKRFINEIEPSASTGEFYITEIVRLAHQSGHVCRYYEGDKDELLGVNTRAELALLEKIFQERERKKHLDNGVTLVAPETTFFSHNTQIESDVVVYPYVVFLENVVIKRGAHVGPFCVVEGSTIANAKIGPFSRLRTGTEIQDGVRIGNFVEIKNSVVSRESKINHLSYVGDANIGKNTNIGAGTITCNYDGIKKHRTAVGENVFVGSNAALVAPVEIGDNVTIGAGSVIVKNVENGALAIARNNQTNIANWNTKRKNKKCVE